LKLKDIDVILGMD
jgi:hypothetical protein